MKVIRGITLKPGSFEELLPDFSPDFPYIASRVELNRCIGRGAPWHWHKEVELFYMEEGGLGYDTPQGNIHFPPGSGGFVNSNVLHMSRAQEGAEKVTALMHLFHPILISGHSGSLIDQKYVLPLITSAHTEIIGFYPDNPEHTEFLDMLRQSFRIPEDSDTYEIRLRTALSELWCGILDLARPLENKDPKAGRDSTKIKIMMVFIHRHCGEKISVAQIAAAAYISERECFRAFHDCLNMTPVEYVTSFRLQKACAMLAGSDETITSVCQACGLGSSSYFGKIFRERMGCSPTEYRNKWQNPDKY